MSDLDSVGEKSSNQRLMGVAFMNLGEVKLRPILMDFLKENGAYEAFGKVKIDEYRNKIEFPLNYTVKDLEKECNEAKLYFDKKKENMELKIQEAKREEIESLKKKLAELEFQS